MALEQTPRSGKAIGTRDRVVAWLAANGDVEDPSGMASTQLARSIGYPGSSIAFAQLLSGMERSGLIARGIRGKRTYRVELTAAGRERAASGGEAARRSPARSRYGSAASTPARRPGPSRSARTDEVGLDYDELARRLLFQVARRLAGGGRGITAENETGGPADARDEASRPVGDGDTEVDALERRVAALEDELARARAARLALQEENEALRERIERIRRNLEGSRGRTGRGRVPPSPEHVDHRDIALLQQMLTDRQTSGGRRRQGNADSA